MKKIVALLILTSAVASAQTFGTTYRSLDKARELNLRAMCGTDGCGDVNLNGYTATPYNGGPYNIVDGPYYDQYQATGGNVGTGSGGSGGEPAYLFDGNY